MRAGDALTLGLRPEHLSLAAGAPLVLAATTEYVENLGGTSQLYARTADGAALTLQVPGRVGTSRGETVVLSAPLDRAHLFDAGGAAL